MSEKATEQIGGTLSRLPITNRMDNRMDEQLYTAEQVAKQLAISRSQVFALKATAELPFVKIGRSTRFRRSDVDQFITDRIGRL